MVKADMTRDYYGDLEIPPTADLAEIKKQFKKLALSYHPDRNPGRESDVTAKFQKIQSAHEVLSDPNERAKYDAGRIRSNGYKTGYQGASGVRGNPWANAGSQWAPPPKPPGSRTNRPPPPSAGAARYNKFETPKTSANTANEGAEARKKTYEAWESMRAQQEPRPSPQTGAGRSSWKPPPPARDYTTPSGRDESNSYKHPPPPKTKPGFDEYRANYSPNVSPHRRARSTGAANRRGFTPATPGGDEPAAPKGAYFTTHKPQQAPEPPPRGPPASTANVQPDSPRQNARPDPFRQFRERVDPYETRQSTPYATHGGEKLNPFDNVNLNRSKSTRERSDTPGGPVPRTGSDPNLAQPHRSRSFADRPSKPSMASYTEEARNFSSSEDGPEMAQSPKSSRRSAKPRRTPTGSAKHGQRMPETTARPEHTRKPSLSQFQKWYRENPGQEPPLNGDPSDGPPPGSGQANPQPSDDPNVYGTPQSHSQPSKSSQGQYIPNIRNMPRTPPFNGVNFRGVDPEALKHPQNTYTHSRPPFHSFFDDARALRYGSMRRAPTQETVSREQHASFGKDTKSYTFSFEMHKYPNLFPRADGQAVTPPNGVTADSLNSFEADQRRLVDQLINKRRASGTNVNSARDVSGKAEPTAGEHSHKARPKSYDALNAVLNGGWGFVEEPAVMGSPPKKQRFFHLSNSQYAHAHSTSQHSHTENANDNDYRSSFSFKVDDNTFAPTKPQPNGFTTPSTENINTKFTPEEWEGKFEAGTSYFAPEQKAAGVPRGRTQSATRSRGRSPVKPRPVDPKVMQPHVEEETPIESPGGTKFTPEEWAQSFKPQTFMPPPPAMPPRPAGARKGRQPSLRTTMGGNAAVVDDSENTSDEKPLFTGRKPPPIVTSSPSPDPMEVDTPPVESTETQAPKTPTTTKETLNHSSPSKRAAAPSQSPTDSALKVEFDDLKLRDLISHLNLPAAPEPPTLPVSPMPEYTRPPKAAYEVYLHEFKAYMCDWDLFNNQFMMHMLARKKENDVLGTQRWDDDGGLETYRLGLKADKIVLGHWSAAQEHHQAVMKDYAVLKERMKDRSERERPRKKVY